MTKEEAQTALRQKIAALNNHDLALLLQVANEGINDVPACREIADMVSMKPDQLQEWAERVLDAEDAESDLMVLAENLPYGIASHARVRGERFSDTAAPIPVLRDFLVLAGRRAGAVSRLGILSRSLGPKRIPLGYNWWSSLRNGKGG